MGRPQEFDRENVLRQAMDVFWRKGFDGASIQDLVDATGLNRGSLYNAFGDKAELFSDVMQLYKSQSAVAQMAKASEDSDVYQVFSDFFQTLVDRAQEDDLHKGCLLTNTAAGLYGCNSDMAAWVNDSFNTMEELFVRLIERGQEFEDISSTEDPTTLARSLMASALGLNVMARTGASASTLQNIADQALKTLNT